MATATCGHETPASSSTPSSSCTNTNARRSAVFVGIRSGERNGLPLRGVHAGALVTTEVLHDLMVTGIEFVVVHSRDEAGAFVNAPVNNTAGPTATRTRHSDLEVATRHQSFDGPPTPPHRDGRHRFPPTAKTNDLLADVTRRARADLAQRTAERCAAGIYGQQCRPSTSNGVKPRFPDA